jgi:hypothetical protein
MEPSKEPSAAHYTGQPPSVTSRFRPPKSLFRESEVIVDVLLFYGHFSSGHQSATRSTTALVKPSIVSLALSIAASVAPP